MSGSPEDYLPISTGDDHGLLLRIDRDGHPLRAEHCLSVSGSPLESYRTLYLFIDHLRHRQFSAVGVLYAHSVILQCRKVQSALVEGYALCIGGASAENGCKN